MNTDMDIDINTMTDTITCKLVEARADLGITQNGPMSRKSTS